MAESPSHKFGQIIGELVENVMETRLRHFAAQHDLYLDRQGPRPARGGLKVSWRDKNGNVHDLDFVLERGGSDDRLGTPVAFIETAWRRYTKHSRNKAQEIQGAVVPLAETYARNKPFIGAILAGEFTDGALRQLESLGFHVLFFPYDTIVAAFSLGKINADFGEDTSDADFGNKIRAWERLKHIDREAIGEEVARINAQAVGKFMEAIRKVVTRRIEAVLVLPLHGHQELLKTVQLAIGFLEDYAASEVPMLQRIEIEIRYENGDCITGSFGDKQSAVAFLREYQ